jgi:signal transduction histidine kinase
MREEGTDGGRNQRRRLVSLGDLVQRAVPRLLTAIAARGSTAQLRVAVESPLPSVLADPDALERVLLHLVLNAARAVRGPHGSIEIGVTEVSAPRIGNRLRDPAWLDSTEGAAVVRLTVTDNGMGMDTATLADVLQRIANPAAAPAESGIGLRLVNCIVRRHGGRLHIESDPVNATTVRVDLPAVAQETAADGLVMMP